MKKIFRFNWRGPFWMLAGVVNIWAGVQIGATLVGLAACFAGGYMMSKAWFDYMLPDLRRRDWDEDRH